MADEIASTETEPGAEVALRPCAYCGHPIHPESHRCVDCGGHVGLAWGTVHKELFLFLFLSVLIAVGCLVSWVGRTPAPSAESVARATAAAQQRADEENRRLAAAGRPQTATAQVDEKDFEYSVVVPMGKAMTGLDTLRGALLFALAVYGVIAGLFNVLFRRMVMWPYVAGGALALWVGLQGLLGGLGGRAYDLWKTWAKGRSLMESFFAPVRAVSPGHLLLTLAGVITVVKLVGGVLAAATKGKGDAGGDAGGKEGGAAARRRARGGKGGDAPTGGDAPAAS